MVCINNKIDENAVSPVIAVVLMVAITVILAAIIATYAFGMGTNIPQTKMVTGTLSAIDAQSITVTYNGGRDQTQCVGVSWVVTRASDGVALAPIEKMGSYSSTAPALDIGTSRIIQTHFAEKKHIVATAYFNDGTQQVILDSFI